MIMYHIHKKGIMDEKWQVGEVVHIKKYNDFWKFCLEYKTPIYRTDKEQTLLEMVNVSKETLDIMANAIMEYKILIREITMENARKKINYKLPSRQKCIWLIRKDQIEYWKKHIGVKEFEIFEVDVNQDKLFKSRDSLLPKLDEKYGDILEKAKNYWKYSSNINNEDDEYLYCGDVKVIRKI